MSPDDKVAVDSDSCPVGFDGTAALFVKEWPMGKPLKRGTKDKSPGNSQLEFEPQGIRLLELLNEHGNRSFLS